MTNEERRTAIVETVNRIRESAKGREVTPAILEDIKQQLLQLAGKTHLFQVADFPPPEEGAKRKSCLYRLSEDEDHGFALYLNSAGGAVSAPPHDHTTWAVIVGIEGQEENRFYNKTDDGVAEKSRAMVEPGAGVTLMPEDIHTIHIDGTKPVLNFHMYGLALEQLHGRKFWNDREKHWKVFPAHTDIREARE